VGEYGRRLTPAENIFNGKDKLEQKVIDFEKLKESDLKQGNWDVVFITYVRPIHSAVSFLANFIELTVAGLYYRLGTTKAAAGSAEAFEKIDRE